VPQVLEPEFVSRQAQQNVEDFIADSANSSLKPPERPFSKKLSKRSPAEQTETLLAALISLAKCRENFLTKPLTMRDRTQLWLDGIYDIHSNLVVRTMGKRLRICNELAWLMSETETPEKYKAFRDEWIRKESENQPGPPNTKDLNAEQVAAYEASKTRQAYLGELINLLLVQKSLTLIPEQLELAMYCITERTLQDRSNSSRYSQAIVKPLITYKAVGAMLENFDRNNTADGAAHLGYDTLVSLDQYCQCLRAGINYQRTNR
jgi:hypothetical protein